MTDGAATTVIAAWLKAKSQRRRVWVVLHLIKLAEVDTDHLYRVLAARVGRRNRSKLLGVPRRHLMVEQP